MIIVVPERPLPLTDQFESLLSAKQSVFAVTLLLPPVVMPLKTPCKEVSVEVLAESQIAADAFPAAKPLPSMHTAVSIFVLDNFLIYFLPLSLHMTYLLKF
jgi:hypothetical protein